MNDDKIRSAIIEAATSYQMDGEVSAFVEAFRSRYGDNLDSVLYYGSCLTSRMAKPSSFRDFFVMLREYGPLAKNLFQKIIIPPMPPNQYFMSIEHEGRKVDTKFHVLTTGDFRRISGRYSPDHYIVGRMSKRTALLWYRDEAARDAVLDSLVDAFYRNAAITLPLIDDPVDFHGLVLSFIRTSYMSELRMEKPDKFEAIYDSEKEYYTRIYSMLAQDLVDEGLLTLRDGMYLSSAAGGWQKRKSMLYLRWSKVRHVTRVPRLILAMDNWFEQLLGKFERTHGRKLDLTEWEKRHRYYTVIKYLYKLKIAKNI